MEPEPALPSVVPSRRRDRALTSAVLVAVFFFGFVSQLVPVYTVDVFYHLAVGDWILDEGRVPERGLFSGTRSEAEWVDCEWGFQVLAATVDRLFGIRGLVAFSAFLVAGALTILAGCLLRRGLSPPAVLAVAGVAALALDPLTARPQNITFVFAAAVLFWTGEAVDGRRAPVWIPPALLVPWVNLHAGFIIGLVILGIAAVSALPSLRASAEGARRARGLALAFGLAFAACFLNPYGWKQVYYPLEYALTPGMTSFNLEWEPTRLALRPAYQLLLAGGIAAFALAGRRPRAFDLLLFLAFAAFSLRARRHVGLGVFAVAVAMAPALVACLRTEAFAVLSRRPAWWSGGVAVGVALLLGVSGRVPGASPFGFDSRVVLPVEAADFLVEHRPPGRVFNQYRWGSYLLARFRDENLPFVDGRNDLYGADYMGEYLQILEGRRGYRELMRKHDIGSVLLEANDASWRLLKLLTEDGWICVHHSRASGSSVVILVRPRAENLELVQAFGRPLEIVPPP